MSAANPPKQLRLIIETDDFDEALRFYRDVLGMPEQAAFATEGDDRVAILHAGLATIELATREHAQAIDAVEGMPPGAAPALRIALEVDTPHPRCTPFARQAPRCWHHLLRHRSAV